MRVLAAELRHAARALRRSPLFAGVAVLSLGLALALNTTMFALVDAVLHPRVPYPAPERLVTTWFRGDDPRRWVPEHIKVQAVRESFRLAESSTTVIMMAASVVAGREADNRMIAAVGPDFFDVVGVRPWTGRALRAGDGAQRAVVISFALWRRAFGERPLADGLLVEIGDAPFTVVGVMPPGMQVGSDAAWIPDDATVSTVRYGRWPRPVLRLRADATPEAVAAELGVIAARLTAEHGSPRYAIMAQLITLGRQPPPLDEFYVVMLVTTAIVLVIACANLATLLLARGAARRRELAVRIALGAGRGAIVRHVMTECALLAFAGAALGVLLTNWALHLAARWAPPYVPQLGEYVPGMSWRTFAFALAAAVAVLLLAGVAPALRAAATPPSEPMKDGGGSTQRRGRRYSPLIIAEVALSTALLMTAALFGMSSYRLATYQFRVDARRLVTASLGYRFGGKSPSGGVEPTFDAVLARLRRIDGVRDAATRRYEHPWHVMVVGENGAAGEHRMNLRAYAIVSPSYLRTVGIPVIDGRDFEEGDRSGAGVAIVDADGARRLWPTLASPVGRMLKLGSEDSRGEWVRVVGVTPAVASAPRRDTDAAPDPNVYVVFPHDTAESRDLVIATRKEDAGLPLVIRRTLQQAVPGAGFVRVERWLAGHEDKVRFQTFLAMLYCAFSAFALVLCAAGLYGALAYSVSLRLREFSIRASLGATRRHLLPNVVHDAAVTALAGIGIGAFVALVATRYLMDALYPIAFAEVKALAIAEAILLLVAAAAAFRPVMRAVRANPAEALQAT